MRHVLAGIRKDGYILMKKIKFGSIIISLIFLLNGCSLTKPKDSENYNINLDKEEISVDNINIYYDTSGEMAKHLSDASFFDIVYAAGSSARDTWHDAECNLYKVNNECTQDQFEFLTNEIRNPEAYTDTSGSLLTALSNIEEKGINIIITSLNNQLTDYSSISNAIVSSILSKGNAIAFIGIDTETIPLFILVSGENGALSKYIDVFKNNPAISKYSQAQADGTQVDVPQKINYQIIAAKSGISGIKYDEIEFVENGLCLDENGQFTLKDSDGSFSKLREDYTEDKLNTIEGTVNFTPDIPPMVTVKQPRQEKNDRTNSSDDSSKEKIRSEKKKSDNKKKPEYLGVRSLAVNKKDNTAGKIKMNIPFDIINGVKLSKLDCDIDLNIKSSTGGKFQTYENNTIDAAIAEGVNAEQGKWRVNDATNSIIFNINFKNAADFKSEKEILKLDITFKYYGSIDTVSNWVKEWDSTKTSNLMNLFNSLYLYQKEDNTSENTMTVYVGAGNKSINKRATRQIQNSKKEQKKEVEKNEEM